MKIYLDKTKSPLNDEWTIVRSFDEFKRVVECSAYPIIRMSFGYDLGKSEPNGYDAARWFISYCIDYPYIGGSLEEVIAHTKDNHGKELISGYFHTAQKTGIISDDIIIR